MNQMNTYQDTELGPLPQGWQVRRLDEVAYINKKSRDPRKATPDEVLTYIDISSVEGETGRILETNEILGKDAPSRARRVVHTDDVILSTVRPYLKAFTIIPAAYDSQLCSTGYAVLTANEEVIPEFLLYVAFSDVVGKQFKQKMRGANYPAINVGHVQETKVPLPPLPEQRAIARVLRSVQRARAQTRRVLAATRDLKRSLMHHLFRYGPVPLSEAAHVPLKETEIGEVPVGWEVVALGEVISDGPQNGLYKPQSDYGSGTPIVRIDDYANEGGIITTAANLVRLSSDEKDKYDLQTGDILINRVNSLSHLGKPALVGELVEPTVFESNMMRFRLDTRAVVPQYGYRYLTSPPAREQMRGRAKRAVAQSSINQGDVKTLLLPLPTPKTQHQIAHVLQTIDHKIQVERQQEAALGVLFQSLLHELMTGRRRVGD